MMIIESIVWRCNANNGLIAGAHKRHPYTNAYRCKIVVIFNGFRSSVVGPRSRSRMFRGAVQKRHDFVYKQFHSGGIGEIEDAHDQIFDADIEKLLELFGDLRGGANDRVAVI